MTDLLFQLSELLTRSFFLATILNLFLPRSLLRCDFKSVQLWIGSVLMIGLLIHYSAVAIDIVAGEASIQSYVSYSRLGYYLMLVLPLLILLLNIPSKLRVHKWVAGCSLLLFVPIWFEFFIVFLTSDITFTELNHVYKMPILQMLIAGPVLFVLVNILLSLKRKFING